MLINRLLPDMQVLLSSYCAPLMPVALPALKILYMKRLALAGMIAATFSVPAIYAQKLPVINQPKFKKDTFNIIKYGAKADGLSLNTEAINKAITTCSAKGGGVVLVPDGFWLTGPVIMKNNVNLHLAKNALLQFTDDFSQYKLVETNWEGKTQYRNESPLSATNATNIAITGKGIVDGNGDAWRQVKKDKLTESQWKRLVNSGGIVSPDNRTWYPTQKNLNGQNAKDPGVLKPGQTVADLENVKDFLRPNLLVFTKCKNVLLEGVTFQNSPAWCLHPLMCEHVTLRDVTVKNPWYAQNGDGIDLESCNYSLIENSVFDVGDDALCMKSGRDEEGRKRGMPTQNVIIRNCLVYHAHGGFVIGSEMSGGANNIWVNDCTFIGTDIGLRFKTTRGRGGMVENIYINNIVMKDIPGEAILFDMYYMAKDPIVLAGEKRDLPKVELLPVTDATPQFQNFYIKNVVCDGAAKAIFIRGLPEMHIKNINLSDMVLKADKGIDCQEASGINFNNITLDVQKSGTVAYILNSDKISMNKIKNINAADLFVEINGERSGNIKVTNTDASRAKSKLKVDFGATEQMVQFN